jgi:phosphoenolpyruvate carboxylase
MQKTRTNPQATPWIGIMRDGNPYVTEQTRRFEEAQEAKKKWITGQNFKSKFQKSATEMVPLPNYVRLTKSKPATDHKFREVRKKAWVAGEFKK